MATVLQFLLNETTTFVESFAKSQQVSDLPVAGALALLHYQQQVFCRFVFLSGGHTLDCGEGDLEIITETLLGLFVAV